MSAIFKEIAAPATPATGYVVFYAKADSLLYFKDDTGTEYPVKPIGGGTGDLLSDGSVPLVANWDIDGFYLTNVGAAYLAERAAADADVAGQGQIWVKNTTPCELWYTDDTGTDVQLGIAGATEFADDLFRIKDNGDATKKVAFEVSAVATATTRTITMPDANVNLGTDFATAAQANATHTGEVTGATTLTVDKTAITNRSTVVIAAGDLVLLSDISDSNNLKKGVASDIGAGKRSLWIPVNEMLDGGGQVPAVLANLWTGNNCTLPARAFDASAVELLTKTWSIPNGFDATRGLSFTAFWSPTSTNTGTVRWEIRINDISDGEAEAGHLAAGCYCDDAGLGTANLLHISAESSEAFAGSFTKKNLLNLRIQRFASDAADTYTADANLIGIELHYWTDKNTDD